MRDSHKATLFNFKDLQRWLALRICVGADVRQFFGTARILFLSVWSEPKVQLHLAGFARWTIVVHSRQG
jgi:hypothetical protein